MRYLLSAEELQRARARTQARPATPNAAPAPAFTYVPRSEEQLYARAHQSYRGNATSKPRQRKKPAPLDALIDRAYSTFNLCMDLAEQDFAALRREIAADPNLRQQLPGFLNETIVAVERIRDFMLALEPLSAPESE